MYYRYLEAGYLGLKAVAYLLHSLGLLGLLALGRLGALVLPPQDGPGLGDTGQDKIGVRIVLTAGFLLILLHYTHAFFGLLGLFGNDLELDIGENEGPVSPEYGVQDLFFNLGLGFPAHRVLPLHKGGAH